MKMPLVTAALIGIFLPGLAAHAVPVETAGAAAAPARALGFSPAQVRTILDSSSPWAELARAEALLPGILSGPKLQDAAVILSAEELSQVQSAGAALRAAGAVNASFPGLLPGWRPERTMEAARGALAAVAALSSGERIAADLNLSPREESVATGAEGVRIAPLSRRAVPKPAESAGKRLLKIARARPIATSVLVSAVSVTALPFAVFTGWIIGRGAVGMLASTSGKAGRAVMELGSLALGFAVAGVAAHAAGLTHAVPFLFAGVAPSQALLGAAGAAGMATLLVKMSAVMIDTAQESTPENMAIRNAPVATAAVSVAGLRARETLRRAVIATGEALERIDAKLASPAEKEALFRRALAVNLREIDSALVDWLGKIRTLRRLAASLPAAEAAAATATAVSAERVLRRTVLLRRLFRLSFPARLERARRLYFGAEQAAS